MSHAAQAWSSVKVATRVTEGEVEAEGYLFRSIACRIAADGDEIERALETVESELAGDTAHDALFTVSGIGSKTAA